MDEKNNTVPCTNCGTPTIRVESALCITCTPASSATSGEAVEKARAALQASEDLYRIGLANAERGEAERVVHLRREALAALAAHPAAAPDAIDAQRHRYTRATTTAVRDPETGERIEVTPEMYDAAIDAAMAADPNWQQGIKAAHLKAAAPDSAQHDEKSRILEHYEWRRDGHAEGYRAAMRTIAAQQDIDTLVNVYSDAWGKSFGAANPFDTVMPLDDDLRVHIKAGVQAVLLALQAGSPTTLDVSDQDSAQQGEDEPPLPKAKHRIDHYHDNGSVTSEDGYTAAELLADRRTCHAHMTRKLGAPVAWIATDLDGRGDVAFTKEEAKSRAGEGCTEFVPLYDIGDGTLARAAGAERAVPEGWERATGAAAESGWTWDYQWLESLREQVGGDVGMEEIDALLTVLAAAPSPAAAKEGGVA